MRKEISELLRGAPQDMRLWIEETSPEKIRLSILIIIAGFGAYGLTAGLWRAPEMGLYVALKMPLLIFITLACNGFLNGMLALLLGTGLGFKQSLLAQLMSFTVAALVLGSLAPVTFFMALNAPSPTAPNAETAHSYFLVTHTLLIAFTGIIANLHLARLLIASTPTPRAAATTLAAWLTGNAFVGAQFSWIMRPFFGTPSIKVALFRDNPFNGTFYETVWRSLQKISNGHGITLLILIILGLLIIHRPLFKLFSNSKNS